jgi:hypothetical protein
MGENPVRRRYAIHPLAAARRRIGVAGEDPRPDDGIGPVLRSPENAAQRAHRSLSSLLWGSRTCGERRAKSSAISFIVTNRTPG